MLTTRRAEAHALGIVVGATNVAAAPQGFATGAPGWLAWPGGPGWAPPAARGLVADVGLAASFRLSWHGMGPMMRGARSDHPLTLVVSPVVTLMLDGANNPAFGPHTGIEPAVELSPEVAVTRGGGTLAGLRLNL